jgi:2-polyprenyl-3-methyl-5-hydroxy-6-metoxy-1,4-benzoquinol methylase
MKFDEKRWSEPRKAIATGLNDIQYATHGALIAVEVLKYFKEHPSHFKDKSLLDFGCGTGRIARVLSKVFHKVEAYDPSRPCFDAACTECPSTEKMSFHNVTYHNRLDSVGVCDYGISSNVFEHIHKDYLMEVWNDFLHRVRCSAVVYFSPRDASVLLNIQTDKNGIYLVDGRHGK